MSRLLAAHRGAPPPHAWLVVIRLSHDVEPARVVRHAKAAWLCCTAGSGNAGSTQSHTSGGGRRSEPCAERSFNAGTCEGVVQPHKVGCAELVAEAVQACRQWLPGIKLKRGGRCLEPCWAQMHRTRSRLTLRPAVCVPHDRTRSERADLASDALNPHFIGSPVVPRWQRRSRQPASLSSTLVARHMFHTRVASTMVLGCALRVQTRNRLQRSVRRHCAPSRPPDIVPVCSERISRCCAREPEPARAGHQEGLAHIYQRGWHTTADVVLPSPLHGARRDIEREFIPLQRPAAALRNRLCAGLRKCAGAA